MLYLWFRDSKKKLYINVKAIGQILFVIGWIVVYIYLSNQDYLVNYLPLIEVEACKSLVD